MSYIGQGQGQGQGHGASPIYYPDYGNAPNQYSYRVDQGGGNHGHGDTQPSQPKTPTGPPIREPWGRAQGAFISPIGANPNTLPVPPRLPSHNNHGNAMQNWQAPASPPSTESYWYQQQLYPSNASPTNAYPSPEQTPRRKSTRGHQGRPPQSGGRLRSSDYYTPGRVFVVHWSQQAGHDPRRQTGTSTANSRSDFIYDNYGNMIYSCPRRMVVIGTAPGGNSSLCVGMFTYQGQGLAKRGINVNHHAVVHDERERPYMREDEPRLQREALAVTMLAPADRIDPMSRIDFGKIHTVEHNIEVRDIGFISKRSMPLFHAYVNEAWSALNPMSND